MGSNELWLREGGNFPWSAACALVDVAQDTVGFPCCQSIPLAHTQLAVYHYPQVFCHRCSLACSTTRGSSFPYVGCFICLFKFLSAHSPSPSRSIWMVTLFSSISTIQMLNRIDPKVDPCGTHVVTGLQASTFVALLQRSSVSVLGPWILSLFNHHRCKGTLVGQILVGNNKR